MTEDWPRDESPVESAPWIAYGENPSEEPDVLPAPSPRWLGKAALLAHEEIKPNHWRARLHAPEVAKAARPGQFLHILCSDTSAPLLRRPISISRANRAESWVEVIYRVVGVGTEILSHVAVGDDIDVMGPLGTPFVVPPKDDEVVNILVGGGVGIPPMLFLAEEMRPKLHVVVLLGGRTADLVLCENDFSPSVGPHIITDDGSLGRQGLVTDLLDRFLQEMIYRPLVYACGPVPMLRAVARVCREHAAPCQVAFEARMACGVGACLSCVVPTVEGYQRVCTEGPAFDAAGVVWTAEMNLH